MSGGFWLVKFVPDNGVPVAGEGRTLDAAMQGVQWAMSKAQKDTIDAMAELQRASQDEALRRMMKDA